MAAVFGGMALPFAGKLDPVSLTNAAIIGGHGPRLTAAQILTDQLEKSRPGLFSDLSPKLRTIRNGILDAEGTQVRYDRNAWKHDFVGRWNWMPSEWEDAVQRVLSGMPRGEVPPVAGHSPSEIGQLANEIRAKYGANAAAINDNGEALGLAKVNETARELHPQTTGNEIKDFGNAWLNRHPGTGVTVMGHEAVPGSVAASSETMAKGIKDYFDANLEMTPKGPAWVNGEDFRTPYLDDPELSGKFKALRTQADLDQWIDDESQRLSKYVASGKDRMHPVNEATITDEYRRKYPYLGPDAHHATVKQWADYLARMEDRAQMIGKHSPEMDASLADIRKQLHAASFATDLSPDDANAIKAYQRILGTDENLTGGAYPANTISGDVQTQRGVRGQPALEETSAYFANLLKQTAPLGYFFTLGTNPASAIADPIQQAGAMLATLGPKAMVKGGISRLQRSPLVSKFFGKEVPLDPTKTFSRTLQEFPTSNEIAPSVTADVALDDVHNVLTDPKRADYRNFLWSPDEQVKLLSSYDANGKLNAEKAGDLPWRHVGNVLAAINGTETASSSPALFRGPYGSGLGAFLKTPVGISSSILNSAGKYGFGDKSLGYQARYAVTPLLQALAVRGAKASPYLSSGLLAMSAASPLGLAPAALELYNSDKPTETQARAQQDLETIRKLGKSGDFKTLAGMAAGEAFPSRNIQVSDILQSARGSLDKSAMGAQTPMPGQNPADLIMSQILPGLYVPFSMGYRVATLPSKYGGLGKGIKAGVTNGASPLPILRQLSPFQYNSLPTYTNTQIPVNGVMEETPNTIQIIKNKSKIRIPKK